MKEKLLRVAPLAAYCLPYAFFGMWGDAEKGTIVLHVLWLLCLLSLCRWVHREWCIWTLLIGNAVTFLSSCLCVYLFSTEQWSWYFKPLSAYGMVCAVTAVVLAVQLGWWYLQNRKLTK